MSALFTQPGKHNVSQRTDTNFRTLVLRNYECSSHHQPIKLEFSIFGDFFHFLCAKSIKLSMNGKIGMLPEDETTETIVKASFKGIIQFPFDH